MADASLTYSVMLGRPADEPALAKALANAKKEPLLDAAQRARRCGGLIEQGLGEEAAKTLAAALEQNGAPALALPDGLIEELPAAAPLARAVVEDEGLRARLRGAEETRLFPWNELTLLAAVAFQATESRVVKVQEGPDLGQQAIKIGLSLATGLPMMGGGKKEVEKRIEKTELVEYADLVFLPGRRLRVDAQAFDFSGLGELKAFDALTNFKRLISEIARRAPQALLTPSAAVILGGRPLRESRCSDLAGLERDERWLLTLRALGKL